MHHRLEQLTAVADLEAREELLTGWLVGGEPARAEDGVVGGEEAVIASLHVSHASVVVTLSRAILVG